MKCISYDYYMYDHHKLFDADKSYQLDAYSFKNCLKQHNYILLIMSIINKNPNIVSLNLMGCHLDKDDLFLLVELLKNNTSLVELNIRRSFPVEHTDKLIELLDKNKSITSLDLSGNEFKEHLGPFIEALKSNTKLMKLNLSDTELLKCSTSRSMFEEYKNNIKLISEMLKVNTTLTELSLSDNFIKHIRPIINALSKNSTLTSLDLSDNYISKKMLIELLKNISLKELDFHHNIDIKLRDVDIWNALKYNTSLTKLKIDVCSGDGYGYDYFNKYKSKDIFEKILQHNTTLKSLELYYYCKDYPKYGLEVVDNEIIFKKL